MDSFGLFLETISKEKVRNSLLFFSDDLTNYIESVKIIYLSEHIRNLQNFYLNINVINIE